jgi:CheY-like chemotaxis protein
MTAVSPIQCFVIDDDPDDQEIFTMAIRKVRNDIDIIFANDGLEALEKLNDHHFTPHYIFIDINMPRMNGRNCLVELKKIDRLRNVPMFIYSTYADPEMKEESRKLKATDYIVKPPSIKLLTDILRNIVR